ncbi:MAG: HlyD family efflux transporter periplasmic adaptor subunit [Bacteroidetes bacterium CHB5]|nr:HlyD family efflux transporter periplasmic adaptor subunit [Bacteroidetes bacterium CHB5]
MKRNQILTGVGAIVVAGMLYFLFVGGSESDATRILTDVKYGEFKVEIETTGELEAKNSVNIMGPTALRDFRIFELTIQSIVDEGVVVKKGDWIANLDRSDFQGKFSDKQIELEKANSKYTQTQLDTTLIMRQSRDELINLRYAVDERKIVLEQSKFEPPATIKQNEIELEKAQRAYQQAIENYKIKRNQNIEKMREVAAELRKVKNETDNMARMGESFTVLAPEGGMVIYTKDWDGRPIKGGSRIGVWDPVVAKLPDLTSMISKTYVNEVDVRKIKTGQSVNVGLDAYPDKKLKGKVVRVANVGEQRPNSDAKVFEVTVEIEGSDPSLRPAMTTSNKIIASQLDSVLYIPLECLHSQSDTITYVYKSDGLNIVKQEVMIDVANANDVVIKAGLTRTDKVYLSNPSGQENKSVVLLPEMNGKRKKPDVEETEQARQTTQVNLPNP